VLEPGRDYKGAPRLDPADIRLRVVDAIDQIEASSPGRVSAE